MSVLIERIRAKGHWDIAIRPEPFRPTLVPYGQLDTVLNRVAVRFRGWPVPFIGHRQPLLRHQDWIGQDIDAQNVPHEEAWRFFTSGQFTQLRVISADRWVGADAAQVPGGAAPVIEVWEILFYLTEVVELAARLAMSDAGGDQITVDVSLHGLKDRLLISGAPGRALDDDYRTSAPSIQDKRTLQRDHLVAEPRQIAVEIATEMFLRFGFKASYEVMTDYQQQLTEGR